MSSGNALKRFVQQFDRPGIEIGSWRDFRHTCGMKLRKHGWSAKARVDILGDSSLQVTDGVYDDADQQDFREALTTIATEMFFLIPGGHTSA